MVVKTRCFFIWFFFKVLTSETLEMKEGLVSFHMTVYNYTYNMLGNGPFDSQAAFKCKEVNSLLTQSMGTDLFPKGFDKLSWGCVSLKWTNKKMTAVFEMWQRCWWEFLKCFTEWTVDTNIWEVNTKIKWQRLLCVFIESIFLHFFCHGLSHIFSVSELITLADLLGIPSRATYLNRTRSLKIYF